jgi:hypothetical protein
MLDYSDLSVADLEDVAKHDAEAIIMVANKSGNLKSTFVRGLKDRALSFLAVTAEMTKRNVSEETSALQATVGRLSGELA